MCLAAALGPGAGGLASAPAEQGQIRGQVVDRTPPVHPLAGQVVRLAVVERGSSSERRAVTGGGGRFAFAGLPIGGVRVFLVQTEYGGVPYASGRITLTAETPVRSVSLAVYEPARDRSAVRGGVAFAVVEIARGALHVSVIQALRNPTDRAVSVTARDPLVFPLPRGAEAVDFLAGWRDPRLADGAIADAIPVLPGTMRVAYAYGLEPRAPSLVLPWRFPYGAADVEVLVAERGARVTGTAVRFLGTVTEAGRRYERWSGGPVAPGGRIALRFAGLPAARDRRPGVAAALLALTLAAGLALALRRPRPAPS